MKENLERNSKIYRLWKQGHTIDEISLFENIPRSTVGYYVKKFNKLNGSGRVLDFQRFEKVGKDWEEEKARHLQMAFLKQNLLRQVSEIVKMSNYQEKYYALSTIKLTMELGKYYTLTPEESKAFLKAFNLEHDFKSKSEFIDRPTKKGRSLEEILGKAQKSRV